MKLILSYLLLMLMSFVCRADVLLKDTDGKTTPFSALKGKWVLINYWAAWCPSCLDEIAELNRFYKNEKNSSVLYGVNYDTPGVKEQKQQMRKLGIHYPNLLQDPAKKLHLTGIEVLPVTFVFNPQGVLVKTLYGSQTAKVLARWTGGK